jgi:hypothetical protein
MPKITSSLFIVAGLLAALAPFVAGAAGAPAPKAAPTGRTSPHETISQTFDGRRDTRVMIVYGRPYSKSPKTGEIRKVWGELVPFGKVWRMGSDEATLFLTQQAIDLGGISLPAGAYTLDLQPEADGSAKLIVGKRLGHWGIPYSPDTEVARISLQKEATNSQVDQFTMALERNPAGGGSLKLSWENSQYSAPFTIKKN